MVMLPAGNYEPDRSRFNGQMLADVLNCLPTADGWGPLPSIVEIQPSGAVAGISPIVDPVLTAYYATGSSGTERIFAFTATTIYEFSLTDYGWNDVSRVGADYASTGPWSVALFGDVLYAQNGTDTEQFLDLTSGTVFADNATAPVARFIATVGDFLVRGSISGEPNKLQWSGLNNPASNDPGVDGSDYQLFPDGEEVMGIIPMSFGAIIPMRSAFFAMNFALSSEYVFTFAPMNKHRGTYAPWTVTALNQDQAVMYCTDGFYLLPSFQPIGGERVDTWLFDNSDADSREQMQAMIDPARKMVWFKYVAVDSTSKLLGWNWQLDRWTRSDMQVQTMFRSRTLGVSIDGMDAYFATIDDADVPFDSSIYDGGQPLTGVISMDGYLGYISGSSMAAYLDYNEISINGPSRSIINGGRIVGDAVDASVTLSVADYQGGALTAKTARTPSSRTRFIPLLGDGRVHKIKIDIAAAADWSVISGIDIDVKGTGKS